MYYHRFPKGDVPDTEVKEDSLREVRAGELKQARDSVRQASVRDTVLSKVSPEEGEIVRYITTDSSGVGEADTLYVYREADSLAYGSNATIDSTQVFSADSTLTTDSISPQPRMVTDTIFMIKEVPAEKPDSEKSSSSDESKLEKRMDELESENAELREAVEEAKNAEPQNTETKTETNTITERVIEREGDKSRNTIIPVPIPTGGKNKDQKEVLENQSRMEGQIDSLEAKIDRMQKSPTPSAPAQVDSTHIEYIVTPSYSYSQMPVGEEALPDSAVTDTLSISGPNKSYGLETRLNSLPESHFIAPLFRMPLTQLNTDTGDLNRSARSKQASTESSRAALQEGPKSQESPKTPEESKDETGNASKYSASYPVKVLFGLNRHELPQAYTDQLDQVVRDLKANPGAEVVITGYTDKSGDPDYNRSLSERRARGVKNYLMENGVSENSISINAAGNEQATEDYNKEMRKVEVALSR